MVYAAYDFCVNQRSMSLFEHHLTFSMRKIWLSSAYATCSLMPRIL